MTVTIGELRKAIEGMPDDMQVAGIGRFGTILECDRIVVLAMRDGACELGRALCVDIATEVHPTFPLRPLSSPCPL